MAVPDTNDFSLQDVVNEINPSSNDLQTCFDEANSADFDSSYEEDKNELDDFRNYNHLTTLYSGSLQAGEALDEAGYDRYDGAIMGFMTPEPSSGTFNQLLSINLSSGDSYIVSRFIDRFGNYNNYGTTIEVDGVLYSNGQIVSSQVFGGGVSYEIKILE